MKIDGGDKIRIANRDALIDQYPRISKSCFVWEHASEEQTVSWGEKNLSINSSISVECDTAVGSMSLLWH
jgi:hypothetical protein